MSLQHQLRADLALRASLLPAEVATWRKMTETHADRMVIHQSQVRAVEILLTVLQERQERHLAAIDPALDSTTFGGRRLRFESELNGAHGLAAVFRYLLSQREDDDQMGRVLDLADRVAADDYRGAMKIAQTWGAIDADKFREPPLTYFHTAASALAFTRKNTVAMLGLKFEGHSEQPLPIPVIALPFHQAIALWSFCGIHHEVGHLLDQDLAVSEALRPRMEAALAGSDVTRERWLFWLTELMADAFGVLFGGSGFASYMTHLLLLPEGQLTRIELADKHPPGYLRVLYIAAVLRATEVPELGEEATVIESTWKTRYTGTPELEPYVAECDLVAGVIVNDMFASDKMAGKTLRDFAPDLAETERHARALASHLTGEAASPADAGFPLRAIPNGAQRAIDTLQQPEEAELRALHEATLAFYGTLPEGDPMGVEVPVLEASPTREAYLRELAEALTFKEEDEA